MNTKHSDSWREGIIPALILIAAILLVLIDPGFGG